MAMENQTYVKLNNGIEMPQFGMGVYMVPDGPATVNAVAEALRQGYRHIDTAHAYQNERSVGKGAATTRSAAGSYHMGSASHRPPSFRHTSMKSASRSSSACRAFS